MVEDEKWIGTEIDNVKKIGSLGGLFSSAAAQIVLRQYLINVTLKIGIQ